MESLYARLMEFSKRFLPSLTGQPPFVKVCHHEVKLQRIAHPRHPQEQRVIRGYLKCRIESAKVPKESTLGEDSLMLGKEATCEQVFFFT